MQVSSQPAARATAIFRWTNHPGITKNYKHIAWHYY